jgi:hypothetical protein
MHCCFSHLALAGQLYHLLLAKVFAFAELVYVCIIQLRLRLRQRLGKHLRV